MTFSLFIHDIQLGLKNVYIWGTGIFYVYESIWFLCEVRKKIYQIAEWIGV